GSPLYHGTAAVSHHRSSPEVSPRIAVKQVRRSGMSLIKCRDDPLARGEGFVTCEAARHRAIKERSLQCVLKTAIDPEPFKFAQCQDEVHATRAGLVEVDW